MPDTPTTPIEKDVAVVVLVSASSTGKLFRVESANLSERELEAVAQWHRDRRRSRSGTAREQLRDQLGKSHVAFVHVTPRGFPYIVPPAITVPFEALPLDETDARMAELIRQPELPPGALAEVPSRSFAKRAVLRYLVLALERVDNWIPDALKSVGEILPLDAFLFYAMAPVAIVSQIVGLTPAPRRWLLPGGIAFLNSGRSHETRGITLLTPRDTDLSLRPGVGGWVVQCQNRVRSKRLYLSDLEAWALLAAWQSHVACPSESYLTGRLE